MRSAPRATFLLRKPLRVLLVPLARAFLALTVGLPPDSAQAQSSQTVQISDHRARKNLSSRRATVRVGDDDDNRPAGKEKKKPDAGKDAKSATRPLFAVVSIADQHVSIYNHNGLVARSVVSTGMAGHRTPTGIFTIIGRERFHRSNIYSAAPMPFMQRITWSGVAMHLGVVPGFPASHGCIRLPSRFASELWGLTKVGERVVIAPRDTAPHEFSHALLPVPKMQPDPAQIAESEGRVSTGSTSKAAEADQGVVRVAANSTDTLPAEAPVAAAPKLLNPIAFAAASKAWAAAESARAAKAVKAAFGEATAKTAEARRTTAAVKVAEGAKEAAAAAVAAALRAVEEAQPERRAAAEDAKTAADSDLAAADRRLGEAKAIDARATALSFEAVTAWKAAKAAAETAAAGIKEAARRVSPVSVLVSKKDQRVYVRQALAPLLDAPAAVRDPELPLGTHVYIASAEQDDGASLKWTVISMPGQARGDDKAAEKNRKKSARDEKPTSVAPRAAASGPAEALERIDIPADIRERISELLWTGGSLIITDNSLSDETSDTGTDLVVNTR